MALLSPLIIHIRVCHRHEAISGGRPTHLASWSVGKAGWRPHRDPAAARGSWFHQGAPRGRRGRGGGPGWPRTHLAAAGPMMPPAAGTRRVTEGGVAPRGPGCATSRNAHRDNTTLPHHNKDHNRNTATTHHLHHYRNTTTSQH